MVLDVMKGYWQVANGLGDVAVQRARELAEALTSQGVEVTSQTQEQVQVLTDEILEASRTNRDLLTGLIRTEVDRAVGRMGFVREEELAAVRHHVQRLEDQLRKEQQRATDRATGAVMTAADVSRSAAAAAGSTVTGAASKVRGLTGIGDEGSAPEATARMAHAAPDPAPAAKTAPQATTAKKTPAQKTTAKKAPAKKATAKKAPAKKAAPQPAATKPAATKTAAKKPAAKKTAAKKAPAKTTTAKKASTTKKATPRTSPKSSS